MADLRSRLRASYHGRALASTRDRIAELMPRRGHARARAALIPIAAFVIVYLAAPAAFQDFAIGAIAVGTGTVVVLFAIALFDFLLLAPRRLDASLRAELADSDSRVALVRAEVAQELADATGDRDRLRAALHAREEAARVTVSVRVAPHGTLQTVDVSPAAVESWLDLQRRRLGTPNPAKDAIEQHLGWSTLFREKRTPDEFLAEVDDWIERARPLAREAMLHDALSAQLARIHVIATNNGPRQLSHVIVRVTIEVQGSAWIQGAPFPGSRLPDPPEPWRSRELGTERYGPSGFVSLDRFGFVGTVRRQSDSIVIELEPLILPSGDSETAGVIFLALTALDPPVLRVVSRVTAKEAEGSAEERHELPVSRGALTPDALLTAAAERGA